MSKHDPTTEMILEKWNSEIHSKEYTMDEIMEIFGNEACKYCENQDHVNQVLDETEEYLYNLNYEYDGY